MNIRNSADLSAEPRNLPEFDTKMQRKPRLDQKTFSAGYTNWYDPIGPHTTAVAKNSLIARAIYSESFVPAVS